jgi:NAD(P)-dependent dehydrogenase (short-subunit alcohol dehydrogenase family)
MHIKSQDLVNSHKSVKTLNRKQHHIEPKWIGTNMTTLIIGASGATGRLLVEELLARGQSVKIIVRSLDSLPETFKNHANLSVIKASVLDLSDAEMVKHTHGCSAVISCLGHNLTLKGMFGGPRRLVTDATRRMCDAIRENEPLEPVKFVLMNTTGNSNRDLDEQISFGQKCVMILIRLLLPPHVDNEKAAEYLRSNVGQNDPMIEWAAVRPDGLIDETKVTDYDIHKSPTRSAIFDAGTTSRINVAHFMGNLTDSDSTWKMWRGEMPVIYNKAAA